MLTTRNGLPCKAVHWITEDPFNAVWLYTACGVIDVRSSGPDSIEAGQDAIRGSISTSQTRPGVIHTPDRGCRCVTTLPECRE